ncbi:MAG: SWIM zinc finger family protein [Nitrosopumilus sp.]|nr:SWIM zinc finger family protein [Nitrosopumilus sp.]
MLHHKQQKKAYDIKLVNDEWTCTCEDCNFRHVYCKHIYAVLDYIK